MESTFHYSLEDIDAILANAKERLTLNDECTQITCIERISNLLKSGGPAGSVAVLSKLIKFDVLSTVFEILQTFNNRLLPCILDFLKLIISYEKFYESHVATDAMEAILKVTVCIVKSRSNDTQLLEKLISTIFGILQRALDFNVDLDEVFVPQQVLILLKSLISDDSLDQKIKFHAVAVLNLVLENIDTEDELDGGVFELCHKALNLMKEIVEYSDQDVSISQAANTLCAICASCSRLCVSESGHRVLFGKVWQMKDTLSKEIHSTTIKILISYGKSVESIETDRVKFHRNLVTCLNNLYKLSSGSGRENLSNHLAINGYLKYFLLLTTSLPENSRRSTCILLSKIISALSDEPSRIDHSPGEDTNIKNLIHRGLLDLPKDPDQWLNVLARDVGNSGVALSTLIYYHYLATKENDMICLKSLITRTINLPKSERTPAEILKVLWFLFAVASVSHPSPAMEPAYDRAVRRLAVALQYSRLNDCYTHHIDLLNYCLKCAGFPKDLRNRTMDIWLMESDGDVRPLLTLDCAQVVQHYLLLVIQTGYSDKIIHLAMKGIREMIRVDNAKEIAEIAWHMLPNLLSSYQPSKDEQTKAVLELTNVFVPDSLSTGTRNRCADCLIGIVLRKDSDLKLRTLAVMQSYALLVTSATIKPFTILEKYCGTPCLLQELLLQGFADETPELSAVCLKLVAFIVHCQGKSSVQHDKPVTIDAQSLADLLLNARRSVRLCANGMQLLLELLQENVDGSPVRLDTDVNGEQVDGVVNLYETLHILHGSGDPTQRDTMYECLEGLLKHCHRRVKSIMYHLCTSMSNYELVSSVLRTRNVSDSFLTFLSTWLRYRKKYCAAEEPRNPRSLCDTPFEETLDQILEFVAAVKESRKNAAFYTLLYAVSDGK